MSTFSHRLKTLRWYHWTLLALVLLYLLYVALSYLYLPNRLKQLVEQDLAAMIGRDIQVQPVAFNPFALSLRVEQFSVAGQTPAESPLLAFDQLYVDFSPWGSLFGWQIKLQTVDLQRPQVYIERQQEGFNFSDILQRLQSGADQQAQESAAAESGGVALAVDKTVINRGRMRYVDAAGSQPARSEIADISIEVHDLYLATGEEQLNPFSITAAIPGGGEIQLGGDYRLDPLQVDSRITARAVALTEFSDFLHQVVPLRISDGKLDLQTQLTLQQQHGQQQDGQPQASLQLLLQQGAITVTELGLDDAVTDPPMARVERIVVEGITLDLAQRSLAVASIRLQQPEFNQWLGEDGKFRIQHLLAREVAQQNSAPDQGSLATEPADTQAWNLLVENARLVDGRIHFTDRDPAIEQAQTLSQLNLSLQNLTLNEKQETRLQVDAVLNDTGELALDGHLVLVPFSAALSFNAREVPLAPVSDYVERASYLRLQQGRLQLEADINVAAEETMPVTVSGQLQISDFNGQDTRNGRSLLRFEQLQVNGIELDTGAESIAVAELALQGPETLVARDPQGLNWAGIIKAGPQGQATEQPEPPPEAAETSAGDNATEAAVVPWQYRLGATHISEGLVRFEDRSVESGFSTAIHNLDLKLAELGSCREQATPFSLKGKVDRYAPLQFEGTLQPLAQQPGFAFTSQLSGLEMPPFSPYATEFIGYKLARGTLSLDLDYSLQQGRLQGKNQVRADQLYLGDKVPGEAVVNAPVALGLALLRNVNGVIDLNVGVSGDISDPGFSVSGVVLQAFINVLVKAATSPFQLLGSLVGGGEDLGKVAFAAGAARLDADNRQRLQQLKQALDQRPQLRVRITGTAADRDREGLRQQQLQAQVAQRRGIAPETLRREAESPWWRQPANWEALRAINRDQGLADAEARAAELRAARPELDSEAIDQRVQALMVEDLLSRLSVSDEDLLALADRRALAIKQHLVDQLQLDHTRVTMAQARREDLGQTAVKLGLEPL
ncbi:MAG: hypothetical protein CML06_05900 [Pseudomonadales bacterium]|nr:hypothetical protein [Pseudomonadales bacterium]